MCEIAVLDPQSTTTRYTFALLERMYEQNNDGVGMVAVDRDRTRLSYASYSAATPTWREVLSFMESHSDAWRMVLHARLATAGETTDLEAHPIPVSCDKCETSMVVHNGIVQRAHRSRRSMDDHSFKTAVDSEVIAHKHGDLPDTLDGFTAPRMYGSLNYILFGENRILVRSGYRYDISDDFRMAHDWRKCAPDDGESSRFLLVKPDGTESEPIHECTPSGSTQNRVVRLQSSYRQDSRAHVQTSMDSDGERTSNRSNSTFVGSRTSGEHENGDEDGKSERQRKYERYQSQADAREDAPDDADEAEPDADDGELATQETEMEDYFPGWRNVLNWAKDNGDDPDDDDDGDAPGGTVVQL